MVAVGFGATASDDGDDGRWSDNDPLASDYEIEGTIDATDDDGDSENDDDDTASVTSASSVSPTASQRTAKVFFAPAPTKAKGAKNNSFASPNLSHPLIRALTAMSLSTPTPIQAQTIPLALEGQDIATTGSGKTLAFLIPTLERLLYREFTVQVGSMDEVEKSTFLFLCTREN